MLQAPAARRVNPAVHAAVGLCGLVCMALGMRWIGGGVIAGAALAFVHDELLSRRVDFAADMGDVGRAMLVMQLGLLLTCTVIGIVTVILVKLSLAMAISAAAGFAVAHIGTLVVFYWTRARRAPVERSQAS